MWFDPENGKTALIQTPVAPESQALSHEFELVLNKSSFLFEPSTGAQELDGRCDDDSKYQY